MTGARYEEAIPGHLSIKREPDPHGIVLRLVGELDLASVRELDRQLRELEAASPGRLLIDLGGLDFMDSSGLALLIRAQQSANANGHRLTLRPGPAQVQRLFELTDAVDRFTFED